MDRTPAWLNSVTPNGSDYDCQMFIDGDLNLLRVKDQVTDSSNHIFDIVSFYNPLTPSQNDTNSLFQDGWNVTLKAVGASAPAVDSGWQSFVETPLALRPNYFPEVAWLTTPSNVVSASYPAYTYELDLIVEDPSDYGAGTAQAGDYLVDNEGNIYEILSFTNDGSTAHAHVKELFDINASPIADAYAYIYRPKAGASIINQASLEFLGKNAEDRVRNIDSVISWQHRGVQLVSNAVTTDNITKLSLEGFDLVEGSEGWQGGKSLTIKAAPGYELQNSEGVSLPTGKPIKIQGAGVSINSDFYETTLNFDSSTNLGIPTDGTYADGLLSLEETTPTADAVDSINKVLSLLAPAKPTILNDCSLVLTGTYTAKEAGLGITRTPIVNTLKPEAIVDKPFSDGDKGLLSARIDGAILGTIPLDTNDNSGTNGILTILTDVDPYAGQFGKQGFWKQLTAKLIPSANLAIGQHIYQLDHSETGTCSLQFYVDNAVVPTITSKSVIANTASGKKVSGIPCFTSGDTITVSTTVTNAIKKYYNQNRIVNYSGSHFISVDAPLPSTPPATGSVITVTGQNIAVANSAFSPNAPVTVTAYSSSESLSSNSILSANIRIDSISNETLRKKSGTGDYPTVFGTAYDSSELLTVNQELQLEGGEYKYPPALNYSTNLIAGPDYSTIADDYRWATFLVTQSFNGTGFTFTINGASNFTHTLGLVSGIKLYAKVGNATGWIDCNAAYPGVGNPSLNGDPALSPGSNATTKIITLGSVVRNGDLFVRIGLPLGSNKKFTGIS